MLTALLLAVLASGDVSTADPPKEELTVASVQALPTTSPSAQSRALRADLHLALGAASGIAGAAASTALLWLIAGMPRDQGLLVVLTTGLIPGYAVGATLGTYLVGQAFGGDGALLATAFGGALGLGAAFALLATNVPGAFMIGAAALPVAGAYLGYRLSGDARRETASVAVRPVVGADVLGLALEGRF